jgi:hypothetical protein
LGWEHVRVWSTDLFRDPARDVARVVAAAQRASKRLSEEETSHVAVEPADQEPVAGPSPDDADGTAGASAVGASAADIAVADTPTADTSAADTPAETADDTARKRRIMRRRPKTGPEQTLDDTDRGWGEHTDQSAHDRWLQEQRPPHWGSD